MASGAVWPMRSFPASGVTGLHTIGVIRGPAGGARCRERGALTGTSRRSVPGARAVPARRQRGWLPVAGRLVRWRLPGTARTLALAHDLRFEAPLAVPGHRPQRDHHAQAAAPADGPQQVRFMAGAGADQVTVRGDELGRGDAAPASVPMLTEPASAQQDAVEFPGIPIPPTVTYPQRHPARKTPGQIRSHRSGRPSLRLSGRCGPRARAGPGRGPG